MACTHDAGGDYPTAQAVYAVTRERTGGVGESVYRILGTPGGSDDRVAIQAGKVKGRRDPKSKTKRAA